MKKYLDYSGLTLFFEKLKLHFFNFNTGHNTLNTLLNIPVDKRIVYAEIKNNSEFSLGSIPPDGKDIHVIVKNISTIQLIITLPNSAPYIQTNVDIISVDPNKVVEINALSDGKNIFLRAA